jgi:hypothetical protein
MGDPRRFSAAPVNFDRFVALNRSHSRSLSPDNELHQMLRPYQSRPTTTAMAASSFGGGQRKLSKLSLSSSSSSTSLQKSLHKVERRSTDIVTAPCTTALIMEGPATQAATPPSRSVSGGAATAACAGTSIELAAVAEQSVGLHYICVDDETAELQRSQFCVTEEVDVLLRSVQQLGCPLYNPVTDQFVCWNLHILERRSRASYGDIEGVSCDFCGDTDWLDTLVEEEKGNKDRTRRSGGLAEVKAEARVDNYAAPSPHHRFLYHCPVCAVDICRACLTEVRAEERFHVPCLQCQRCGAYETRQDAPLHQCGDKSSVKEEDDAGDLAASWVNPPRPPSEPSTTLPVTAKAPPIKRETETAATKYAGAIAMRSHVRLGLSRRGTKALVTETTTATLESTATTPMATEVEKKNGFTIPIKAILAASSSASPLNTDPTASPRVKRKHGYAPRDTTATRRKLEPRTESDERGDLPVEGLPPSPSPTPSQQHQHQRLQGALPSRGAAPKKPAEYSASTSAEQQSVTVSTARYEVHVMPRSSEEAEEVRRIAREQHLQLFPPPTTQQTSVAYFPTRLAAESCVERATVGSVEATLKRHIHDLES